MVRPVVRGSALKATFAATWFGAAATGGLGLGFRIGAPDDQQFADMLNRGGLQFFADGGQVLFAYFPVVVVDADFDQFVTQKAGVDFLQDRLGQPVLADRNNRVQGVGIGTQGAALV